MSLRCIFPSVTLLTMAWAWAPPAHADEGTPTPEPVPILGGQLVEPCGFPTAVSVNGSCTGTLVHPRVVVYAAHCGDEVQWIRLGNRFDIENPPGIIVSPERCETHPIGTYGFGTDAAYCLLSEPIEDVPVTPPLMGCDADAAYEVGQPVTVVGFGNSDDEENPYGIKRYLDTQITALSWDEVFIGGEDEGVCYGDSGGPTYTQVADGSWRSFGITSWGQPGCGFGGYLSTITNNIDWIETASGIDITPCHDGEGNWDPSEDCRGFDVQLHADGGDWDAGCDFGAVTEWSSTCGEPWDPNAVDSFAPDLWIVTPSQQQRFDPPEGSNKARVDVRVTVSDTGTGVGALELVIENEAGQQARLPDAAAPFGWEQLVFDEGAWLLWVEGSDRAGNEAKSAPISIGVGVDAPAPPEPEPEPEPEPDSGDDPTIEDGTDDGADDGGSSAGESGGGSDDGGSAVDPAGSCACTSGREGGTWLLLLPWLALVRRRRAIAGLGALALGGCGDDIPDVIASDTGLVAGASGDSTGSGDGGDVDDTTDEDDDGANRDSSGEPPVPGCGNGIVEDDELCDDGNAIDGDGCSAACEPSGEVLSQMLWPEDGLSTAATAIANAPDGSYVVAGWREIEDAGSAALVAGVSSELEVSWSVEIQGDDPADFVVADALSVADDGAIWIAGRRTYDDAMDEEINAPWLARVDADGTVQWSLTPTGVTPSERIGGIAALSNGDAIAAGSYTLDDGRFRATVRRYAAVDGAVVWEDVDAEGAPETAALAVAVDESDRIVSAGWKVADFGNHRDLRLRRYEADGRVIGTSIYNEPLTTYYGRAVSWDADGNVVFCGSVVRASAENAVIGRLNLDNSQPVVWLQRVESFGQGATGCDGLSLDALGRIAIAGFAFHPDTTFDHLTGRISAEGEVLWAERIAPVESYLSDFARGVVHDEDGNLVVVGSSQSGANVTNLWIARVRG